MVRLRIGAVSCWAIECYRWYQTLVEHSYHHWAHSAAVEGMNVRRIGIQKIGVMRCRNCASDRRVNYGTVLKLDQCLSICLVSASYTNVKSSFSYPKGSTRVRRIVRIAPRTGIILLQSHESASVTDETMKPLYLPFRCVHKRPSDPITPREALSYCCKSQRGRAFLYQTHFS